MYGWVRGDQTTIIQGYAQPLRTYKRQNRYPKLKFIETLIWMQGEQSIEPQESECKVKSNGEVTSLYRK